MKLFSRAGATSPSRRTGSPPMSPGRLRTEGTRRYVGGYADDVVEDFGAEDGAASLHDPAVWGDVNTRPSSIEVINKAHETSVHLIGDVLRADIQTLVTDIEAKLPQHHTAATTATRASDESKSAQIRHLALAGKMAKLGLATPDPHAFWKSTGVLLALFTGDWALIAVSFQMLGLSDRPWIPGFPFSDDLHLAALASVVALVILAHSTGVKMRRLHHDAHRRRLTVDVAERAQLPPVSVLDIVLASVFLLIALVAVIGIGAVRVDYLLASGVPVSAVPFMLIQVAVLLAAVVVAFEFAHPLEREWKAATVEVARAAKGVSAGIRALDRSTGWLNADIELLSATVARAGHHVAADESNAIRQGQLFLRRATLSQPETTTEALFPEQVPVPAHLSADSLLVKLTGITSLPEFVKVTTSAFHAHHAANQDAVRAVAALLERAELAEAFNADQLEELDIVPPVTPLVAVTAQDEDAA